MFKMVSIVVCLSCALVLSGCSSIVTGRNEKTTTQKQTVQTKAPLTSETTLVNDIVEGMPKTLRIEFSSLEDMIKTADTYKTIDDIYKSAGFEDIANTNLESYDYYTTENTIKMILKDRFIVIPEIPQGYRLDYAILLFDRYSFLINKSSSPKSRYLCDISVSFSVADDSDETDLHDQVYSYDITVLSNGTKLYTARENDIVSWFYRNDIRVELNRGGDYRISKADLEKFCEELDFSKHNLD